MPSYSITITYRIIKNSSIFDFLITPISKKKKSEIANKQKIFNKFSAVRKIKFSKQTIHHPNERNNKFCYNFLKYFVYFSLWIENKIIDDESFRIEEIGKISRKICAFRDNSRINSDENFLLFLICYVFLTFLCSFKFLFIFFEKSFELTNKCVCH